MNPLAPSAGRSPQDHPVLLSHPELYLGCLLQDPCHDIAILFLHTSRDGDLTTSQDSILPLDC